MVPNLKTCTHSSTSAQNIEEMEMKKRTSNIEWTSHKRYIAASSTYGRIEDCLYQWNSALTSHVSARPSPMHVKLGLSQTRYYAGSTDSRADVSTLSPAKATEKCNKTSGQPTATDPLPSHALSWPPPTHASWTPLEENPACLYWWGTEHPWRFPDYGLRTRAPEWVDRQCHE